jgi:hypothetical protein
MAIAMRCPGCDTRFEFDSELAGKRIKCKSCGDIFRLEAPKKKRRDEDEEDRPKGRKRYDDEDDDRQPSRSRRAAAYDDENEDRPRGKRRPDDDEDDGDRPRGKRRYEDEDDEPAPRKKKTGLLLLLGGGVFLLMVVAIVVAVIVMRGRKGGGADGPDLVKAPTKSCPLEVKETEINLLVIPDSGNTFGVLRKTETVQKKWAFDPYDIAAGRRLGRVDMSNLDEPRAASLSPDGKYLLIFEGGGFASSEKFLQVWSVGTNPPQAIAPHWNPYPRNPKVFGELPTLYRAEFVGNNKLATVSTARVMDVWPLPAFDPPVVPGLVIPGAKEQIGKDAPEKSDKYQRQLAFTADHSLVAVWNGDGYTFVRTADGQDAGGTGSVRALAKQFWPNDPNNDFWIKAEACAFSPDGQALAGIIKNTWGGKKFLLCIWNVANPLQDPTKYAIPDVQYRDPPGMAWWGNRFIVLQGGKIEGQMIDVRTGVAKRQIMGPASNDHYGFGRDGRLWYLASEDRMKPATVYMVDAFDPDLLTESDDYEQIKELDGEFYLRRLWLEPTGILRRPTRYNPPLRERLIRRP